MSENFIGVFDSGVGGLTVLNVLTKVLYNENFVYFGDNVNAPYGNKTTKELYFLADKNIKTLVDMGAKAIVVACYTISATVLERIKDNYNIKIFGIYPPFNYIKSDKTLMLGTNATVAYYKKQINGVRFLGLENLAGDIEKNIYTLDKLDINNYIKVKDSTYKQVILGCTHYPFLKEKIKQRFPAAKLLDGGKTTANTLKKYLEDSKLKSTSGGQVDFIGDSADFNRYVYKNIVKSHIF